MNFYKTPSEMPKAFQYLVEEHTANVLPAIEAARRLGGCVFRSTGPSFHGRAESCGGYADDGNTSVPGTKYDALWVWDLAHEAHVGADVSWTSWYHGSLCYGIASHLSMHVRDSDGAASWGGVSSDISVGRWPGVKQERIAYSNYSSKPLVGETGIVELVSQVRLVVARLDILAEVKRLKLVAVEAS